MAKLQRLSNKRNSRKSRKSRKTHQRGGSPASSLLFRDLSTNSQRDSYEFIESNKTPSNIVQNGGSLASTLVLERGQDNPGKSYDFLDCANTPKYAQSGGSLSSEMVMGNLTPEPLNKSMAMGVPILESTNKPEYLNSVKLYSPLSGGGIAKKKMRVINKSNMKKYSKSKKSQRGGSRRNRRNNKTKKNISRKRSHSKRSHSRSSRRQSGGGSDWISSQYSAGPVNNAPQSAEMTAMFTSGGAACNSTIDVGKAGSGYPMGPNEGGTTGTVGAPIS